eukprot:sb/3468653/
MSSVVTLLPKTLENADASILTLHHPKNGQKCLVYFANNTFHELLSANDKYVSWFVGDSVIGGEPLTVATKIDPVFLVLPYLMKSPHQYAPLDQTLVDEQFPCAMQLSETDVSAVADVKDERLGIVKFNKEKTINWLVGKVEKVINAMKENGVEPGFNSLLSDKEYQRYAVGIVNDYISATLSSDLHDRLGIEVVCYEDEKPAKRQKLTEPELPVKEKKGAKTKAPKQTKSQRDLANVNTKGMKSMASFFKKK